MAEVGFKQIQRASQRLQHGRITWEIDNANVIRFSSPQEESEPIPMIEFVGEGLATYEIKMIYQPSPNSFPCLVSNPRFTLRVFWDEEVEEYLATPAHSGDMNRSSQWLVEGVQTMNALHEFWRDTQEMKESPDVDLDDLGTTGSTESDDGWLNKVAAIAGTFAGAFGRVYFS